MLCVGRVYVGELKGCDGWAAERGKMGSYLDAIAGFVEHALPVVTRR